MSTPEEWARLYAEGMTTRQIALRFGVTYSRARENLEAAGVAFRPRGRRETPAPGRDRWIERYRAGESTTQIAEGSGLSATAVQKHLRKHGVPLRLPNGVKWTLPGARP